MAEKDFKAVNIGGFELSNPVVFGPHRVNFPEGHLPGKKRIAYYEERAKNQVGMIITEGAQVLPGEYPSDWALNVYENGAAAAWSKLAAAIHKYKTVLVGSLNLFGMQGDSSVTRKPLLAPSAVPEVNSNEVPKVIDTDDLTAIKEGYKFGAQVMKEAGFDGVEINAGQYSLLRQFLSGLTNFRTDAYGGSLENKCRLTVEVLSDVRKILDDDKILGLRLCADEYAPWGGIQPEEAKAVLEYISKQVHLDYVAFENGSIFSTNMTFGGWNQSEDYALIAAKTAASGAPDLKKCVGGSLVSVESIKQALADFDLVDLTRALIADPEFIVKLNANKTKSIVPCILCKEGCHTMVNTNPVIACSMNPLAGEEHKFTPLKSLHKRNLLVAGGGPAGMMAALTALQVGHKVVLAEKSERLGGHFQQFAENYNSPQPAKVINYFFDNFAEYEANGSLKIQLNHEVTVADIKGFDAVIAATGASYQPTAINGNAQVLTLNDILRGNIPKGKRAVVEDMLGDNRCIVACRLLKQAGYEITLVTKDAYFAGKLVKIGEFSDWYAEMAALNILGFNNSFVGYAGTDKLEIVNKYTETAEVLPAVDIAVRIETPQVDNKLWDELEGTGVMRILAGDAVAPRNLQAAIREGYEAVKKLR